MDGGSLMVICLLLMFMFTFNFEYVHRCKLSDFCSNNMRLFDYAEIIRQMGEMPGASHQSFIA